MRKEMYEKQVGLLLRILPEVAKEEIFALHGGTCVNLFVRDLLRLSVDVDLTYIPIEGRENSLANMLNGLRSIADNIHKIIPDALTDLKEKEVKLIVSINNVVFDCTPPSPLSGDTSRVPSFFRISATLFLSFSNSSNSPLAEQKRIIKKKKKFLLP